MTTGGRHAVLINNQSIYLFSARQSFSQKSVWLAGQPLAKTTPTSLNAVSARIRRVERKLDSRTGTNALAPIIDCRTRRAPGHPHPNPTSNIDLLRMLSQPVTTVSLARAIVIILCERLDQIMVCNVGRYRREILSYIICNRDRFVIV